MVEQQSFFGVPVKDSEARLSGKFWFNEDDAITEEDVRNRQPLFYMVRAVCLDVHGSLKSFDKIGGAKQVYMVEADEIVRVADADAQKFFSAPVQLVDQWAQ